MNKTYTYLIQFFFSLGLLVLIATACGDMEKDFDADPYQYPDITVTDFSPKSGRPGTIVSIHGSDFGVLDKAVKVWFNGIEAEEVVSCTDNQIQVKTPDGALSGPLTVKVWTSEKETSDSFEVIPGARVTGSDLAEGLAGDVVTLYGENFGTDKSEVSVRIGDFEAEVVSVTDSEIQFIVPAGGRSGYIYITIGVQIITGPYFTYASNAILYDDFDDATDMMFGMKPPKGIGNRTWTYCGANDIATGDGGSYRGWDKVEAGTSRVTIKQGRSIVYNITDDANTNYTKPEQLKLSVKFNTGNLGTSGTWADNEYGRGVLIGFYSEQNTGNNAGNKFYGLSIWPKNGDIVLWTDGSNGTKNKSAVPYIEYAGNWETTPGEVEHTLVMTVNATTGLLTELIFDDYSYPLDAFNDYTIFTDENTAYVGIGTWDSGGNQYANFDYIELGIPEED